jgi:hypothetical protein
MASASTDPGIWPSRGDETENTQHRRFVGDAVARCSRPFEQSQQYHDHDRGDDGEHAGNDEAGEDQQGDDHPDRSRGNAAHGDLLPELPGGHAVSSIRSGEIQLIVHRAPRSRRSARLHLPV